MKFINLLVVIISLIICQVAQLVEQATENRCVGGSIPPWAPLYELYLMI